MIVKKACSLFFFSMFYWGENFSEDLRTRVFSEKDSIEVVDGLPCFYSDSNIEHFSLRSSNFFFPVLKQMGLRILKKEPFLYVNPLFVRLKKLIEFADKGFLLDEEYLEFSSIVSLFFRKEIEAEIFIPPQRPTLLQQKLKPVLENSVTLLSPKENKERSFQIGEILRVFLTTLDNRGIDFLTIFRGSSLVNQCIAPIWQECSDIDLQIVFFNGPSVLDKLDEVENAFSDALSLLFGCDMEGNKNWDALGMGVGYSALEETRVVHWNLPAFKGSSGNLPCDLSLHFLKEQRSDVLNYWYDKQIRGSFSFFIPIKVFSNSLGSIGPHIYSLSCFDSDLEICIENILKKQFKFLDLKMNLLRRWVRYFIVLTEGFYDPFSSFQEVKGKYSSFFSNKDVFSLFERMIEKKKKNPDYYLFSLVNVIFHVSLGKKDPMNILLIEKLIQVLEKRGSLEDIPWAKSLMALCKQHPKCALPSLLKQIIPSYADRISYKRHIGEEYMQCEFLHQGRVFYLLIPFFKEEDRLIFSSSSFSSL